MQKYSDVVLDRNGNAVPGALVRVKTQAGADATLYASNGADPISNPVTTDNLGRFAFYAANGRYNLVYLDVALSAALNDILLQDPMDASHAQGNVGKTYNLIGAAVRRDTLIAPNWHLVADSAHIPINMSEPTDGVELQLNYTGSKIGTLVVGSDERLAACGVMVGGSVSADKAFLRMGAPCSFTVDLATLELGIDTRFYRLGRFGVSVSASGLITLTHPQRQLNLMPLIQYYNDNSSAELMFLFDIRAASAGTSTLWIKRRMAGRINYTGSAWAASNSPFNADFTFAYDSPTGVLTVTHPTITGNVQPSLTPYSAAPDEYFASVFNSTGTGFQVRFRKLSDGSIPVGTPTGMGFYFDRGISAIDKVPSGKLHVHLGHVQVDMNDVDFPLANIWPLAVMEA